MNDLGASLIRTIIPIIVGLALTAALKVGVELDEGQVTGIATALVTTVYYAVVRFLETKVSPRFGWLLGLPRQPEYPAVTPTQGV